MKPGLYISQAPTLLTSLCCVCAMAIEVAEADKIFLKEKRNYRKSNSRVCLCIHCFHVWVLVGTMEQKQQDCENPATPHSALCCDIVMREDDDKSSGSHTHKLSFQQHKHMYAPTQMSFNCVSGFLCACMRLCAYLKVLSASVNAVCFWLCCDFHRESGA